MRRAAGILAVAVGAITLFSFIVPLIGGTPQFQVNRCNSTPNCSPSYIYFYSSITYYYFGYGGLFVPGSNQYGIVLT